MLYGTWEKVKDVANAANADESLRAAYAQIGKHPLPMLNLAKQDSLFYARTEAVTMKCIIAIGTVIMTIMILT